MVSSTVLLKTQCYADSDLKLSSARQGRQILQLRHASQVLRPSLWGKLLLTIMVSTDNWYTPECSQDQKRQHNIFITRLGLSRILSTGFDMWSTVSESFQHLWGIKYSLCFRQPELECFLLQPAWRQGCGRPEPVQHSNLEWRPLCVQK